MIANGPEPLFKFALVKVWQIPKQGLVVGELIARRLQLFQGREVVVLIFHVYLAVINSLRGSPFGKPWVLYFNHQYVAYLTPPTKEVPACKVFEISSVLSRSSGAVKGADQQPTARCCYCGWCRSIGESLVWEKPARFHLIHLVVGSLNQGKATKRGELVHEPLFQGHYLAGSSVSAKAGG
jgi:hypothetical protein